VSDLQRAITLSARCVAACDAKDWTEASRIMRVRDALLLTLAADDQQTFRDWAFGRMTEGEVAAVLAGPHLN
jgi:hypothetical protein